MPLEPDVSVDLEDVFDGFNEMSRAGRDLRRVWRELAPAMKADLKEHFRAKEGPDGKWPPLAKSTKRRRKGRKPLLGKLRSQFNTEFDHKELRSESRIPWSGAHQDGATVGNGAVLPKRTHMWISEEFIKRALDRLRDHITRRW